MLGGGCGGGCALPPLLPPPPLPPPPPRPRHAARRTVCLCGSRPHRPGGCRDERELQPAAAGGRRRLPPHSRPSSRVGGACTFRVVTSTVRQSPAGRARERSRGRWGVAERGQGARAPARSRWRRPARPTPAPTPPPTPDTEGGQRGSPGLWQRSRTVPWQRPPRCRVDGRWRVGRSSRGGEKIQEAGVAGGRGAVVMGVGGLPWEREGGGAWRETAGGRHAPTTKAGGDSRLGGEAACASAVRSGLAAAVVRLYAKAHQLVVPDGRVATVS